MRLRQYPILRKEAVVAELKEKGIYQPPPPSKPQGPRENITEVVATATAANADHPQYTPEPMVHSGNMQ